MLKFCFHLISWEQIDGFWWNFVYAVVWLAHEIFLNFSTELWSLIYVKISIFRNNEWILIFCLCIDIYDPCCGKYTLFSRTFQQSYDPWLSFRIMFMPNILWNNWWIWSHCYFLCQNMCNNKNKHSGGISCSACNAFICVCVWRVWLFYHMSYVMRKPVVGVCDQVWLKPTCSTIETS